MQKVTPLLVILLLTGLMGSNFAFADYIEYLNLRVPQQQPNICIFEAEDPEVNFVERDLYNKTKTWIKEGWIDALNNYTNNNNWNVTFEFIPNATHYDKKIADFPNCHVFIVFDAKNNYTNDLSHAQGWTTFDYSKSVHKWSFINIYTWSPTMSLNLGAINLDELTPNEDGSYDIPFDKLEQEHREISDEAVRVVIQHEFGHVLGLGHYQDTIVHNYKSIMVPSLEFNSPDEILLTYQITKDDIKATVELYGEAGFKEWNHQPIPKYGYGWVESVTKGLNEITGIYEFHIPNPIWLDPNYGQN